MPWLGGAARSGKRVSGWRGRGRLGTHAPLIAGAVAGLAVLAVLAVAALAGSGGPARVRAASGTASGAGAVQPTAAGPLGARIYPSGNPNPSVHPDTGPAAPPVDAALTLGRASAPVTIVEFGDYQCTSCGEFARDTEPALVRRYVSSGVVAALLAVYAAGMTAPLFALATAWDRLRIGQRRWLRGKGVRIGPLHLHTHSVISGLIFTGLGGIFLRYQGTAGLTGLLAPPSLGAWDNRLQDAVTAAQAHVPDLAFLAIAATAVIAVTAWRLHRARRADTPSPSEPAKDEQAQEQAS